MFIYALLRIAYSCGFCLLCLLLMKAFRLKGVFLFVALMLLTSSTAELRNF